jgi:hypothetical protein
MFLILKTLSPKVMILMMLNSENLISKGDDTDDALTNF